MKINKRSIRNSAFAAVVTVLIGIVSACTDIWSEQHPGTFYISDGQTVATFLEEYQDEDGENPFTDFIYILKRAELWADLKTYGDRTCFAPTNKAIKAYLQERMDMEPDPVKKHFFDNVESLPDSINDTIAKCHICRSSILLKDLNKKDNGSLPASNLLDRYLTYSAIADSTEDGDTKLSYVINQFSRIIEPDDSLVNGIVQVIDRVIGQSNLFVPGYLASNNKKAAPERKANIFYRAIEMTGLLDTLEQYVDPIYHKYYKPQYDSTFACLELTGKAAVEYGTAWEIGDDRQRVVWPDERFFKYTVFVVSDSVLAQKHNIHNIDDLIAFAKTVYTDADHLNDDPTLRTSPINKLISYHILPFWAKWDELNFTNEEVLKHFFDAGAQDSIDMADFYETMLPHSIMRISTPYEGQRTPAPGKNIYINRKGTGHFGGVECPGIRIIPPKTTDEIETTGALNGGYYFVEDLLLYDDYTRNVALNTRLRFMGNTLSPDFMNTLQRDRMTGDISAKGTGAKNRAVHAFKKGFCKNFWASDQTLFVVRYQDKDWTIFCNDEMNIRGIFDLILRLPPVPSANTYEVRIWGNALDEQHGKDRGYVQFYFSDDNVNFVPCDIPVNMARKPDDPMIGYISDGKLAAGLTDDDEKEAAVLANDKAMRNRGYMKAPGSYKVSSPRTLRDDDSAFRKIVTTQYMEPDKDYYLRFRQVVDREDAVCPLNFIELVPRNIYAGDVPEDRL